MADPTPPPTVEELLNAALTSFHTALQTGHSVTFNGRTYTAHELEDLWTTIRNLQALVNGGAGLGGVWSRVAAYCKNV